MKIIDAHVHVFECIKGFGFCGEFRPLGKGRFSTDSGIEDQMFPAEFGDYGVLAEDFINFMDATGIDKAVIMQGPAYGYQNQYLAGVMKKYPERFLAAGFIDPEIMLFNDVLKNLIENLNFKLFKLEMSTIGGIMGCHASNTMLNPNMDTLFGTVEKIGGTIAIDIGGATESSYQIDRVVELAKTYSNLKIVMCHLLEPELGMEENFIENLKKIRQPNIWTDISSLPTILKESEPYEKARTFIRYGKDVLGCERLIWGTDAPGSLVKNNYGKMLKLLVTENNDFTESERNHVVYENALEVFPFE